MTFNVKNEFIATEDYATFWKIKTTISQGSSSIVFQKDCRDYIARLNTSVEGNMAIIFANWSNTDGKEDFELGDQSASDSCSGATTTISDLVIKQYGSVEAQPD